MANRDRVPCHPSHSWWSLRSISQTADRGWAHGRRPAVHAAAARCYAHGHDQPQTSDQLLSRQNVHYTFSGFNFTPTFLDLLLEVGVDRIMFSADHPYASMAH